MVGVAVVVLEGSGVLEKVAVADADAVAVRVDGPVTVGVNVQSAPKIVGVKVGDNQGVSVGVLLGVWVMVCVGVSECNRSTP